jgi:putative nucleotidyltransferase with HDIG domain
MTEEAGGIRSKERERIPTREECLMLMARHGMLDNIVEHSLKVAKVALFLSSELNKSGQRIDLQLVEASSLLHDITKTVCLRTKEDHTRTGYDLLKEIGYERVGEVVAQHVWLTKRGDASSVLEEEVVNYADKRVRHDEIVSLEERFNDLKNRYGRNDESIAYLERLEKTILEIEMKIFLILKIHPDDLGRLP